MHPTTTLIHHSRSDVSSADFDCFAPPIHKASTVFFPDTQAVENRSVLAGDYTYGLNGTPTTDILAQRIALLEGGTHCLLVPSGLSAISLVDLALLKSGDEILIPYNCYRPNGELVDVVLKKLGVIHHFYDPLDLPSVQALINDNTRLMWIEAAGSNSLEFPDLIGLIDLAKQYGITTALDNSWGSGIAFSAFALIGPDGLTRQVDISIQALTKYVSGGADVLMGSVVTKNDALYQTLKICHHNLGLGVGANDVELVLRGLPTLHLRYHAQDAVTRSITQWLQARKELEQVFHPSLHDSQGHEFWAAQTSAAAALVSFTFKPGYSAQQIKSFCNELKLFKLGYSWAGPISLVMFYELNGPYRKKYDLVKANAPNYLVRLAIGLESFDDLMSDLKNAFKQMIREDFNEIKSLPSPFKVIAAADIDGIFTRQSARRMIEQLTPFNQVTLDFSHIDNISTDFIDELLCVWPLAKPSLKLTLINASSAVYHILDWCLHRTDVAQAHGRVSLISP